MADADGAPLVAASASLVDVHPYPADDDERDERPPGGGDVGADTVPAAAAAAAAAVGSSAAAAGHSAADDNLTKLRNYLTWKRNIPLLYDSLVAHHCQWPSLALQWGPPVPPVAVGADAYAQQYFSFQTLYFSQQTDGTYDNTTHRWRGAPALLQVNSVEFPKPWCMPRSQVNKFRDGHRSPFMTTKRNLVHPGEVNRIRVSPKESHIIATQTDSSSVFVWNTRTQVDRSSQVSGGSDHKVLLWDLADHGTATASDSSPSSSSPDADAAPPGKRSRMAASSAAPGASTDVFVASAQQPVPRSRSNVSKAELDKHNEERQREWAAAPRIQPRCTLHGHTATVEDVDVHPLSDDVLCSVGDDRLVAFWDIRESVAAPVLSVKDAHTKDVNCCAWNTVETNYVLTGSSDSTTHLYDWRKAKEPLRIFRDEGMEEVMCLQWAPDGRHFASSGSDSVVRIWTVDHRCLSGVEASTQPGRGAPKAARPSRRSDSGASRVAELEGGSGSGGAGGGAAGGGGGRAASVDRCLLFRHAGHRSSIVDLHWNPFQPWVLGSISDDNGDEVNKGGSTLQLWRINELLHTTSRNHLAALATDADADGAALPSAAPRRRRNGGRRS